MERKIVEGPEEEFRELGFFRKEKKKKNYILPLQGGRTQEQRILIKLCVSSDELLL